MSQVAAPSILSFVPPTVPGWRALKRERTFGTSWVAPGIAALAFADVGQVHCRASDPRGWSTQGPRRKQSLVEDPAGIVGPGGVEPVVAIELERLAEQQLRPRTRWLRRDRPGARRR